MTPQDTIIHLRAMRDELQGRVTASLATSKRRMGLPKDQRETYLTRIQALNNAIVGMALAPPELAIKEFIDLHTC